MKNDTNKKPIAKKCEAIGYGIAIYDFQHDINDHVIWGFLPDDGKRHKAKMTGTYFLVNGRRNYLNDFMKED